MKRQLTKLLVFVVVLGTLGLSSPAHAGNDTSWIPTDVNYYEPTVHSFAFTDKLPLPFQYSVLQGDSYPDFYVCKSTSDASCASSQIFKYNSILKACSNEADLDCVSQVSAFDSNGALLPAKFSKYTVNKHVNAYPADAKLGIPAGDMPGIWSIPSAPHASGNEYAVVAGINGNVDRSGSETMSGSFIQLSLIPVVLKDFGTGPNSISQGWSQSLAGVYYDYCATFQQTDHNKNADCNHTNGAACVFPTNDQGKCYAEAAFGVIQKFNVQVKLSKEPNGWMHGRMVDPLISVTPNTSTTGVTLSVTAGATSVPMVYQTGTWASLPQNIQALWPKCFLDQRLCGEGANVRGPNANPGFNEQAQTLAGNAQINILKYVNSFGAIPLEIMSTITPAIGNKSQALSTTWSMRTLTNFEMNGSNKCFTSTPGIKGIVTTNSTTYSAGPPAFVDNSLSYQVSSPHFNPDGTTPFKGNYNLVMRSDVARCIYGFTKAPIKASISILSSDGANDVATTVANEKDGWLSLSANNFQFSSPTIQVKLSQDAPAPVAAPTPIATPKPDPSASSTPVPVVAPVAVAKKVTITCVKGKITKTVTAVKPICPTGYKKK